MFEIKYFITFMLAIIPAVIWLGVFNKQHRSKPWLTFFVFMGGVLAAQLILLYKGYWNESLNFIFFEVNLLDFRSNISSMFVNTVFAAFAIFLGVGAMEEFGKFLVMRFVAKNHFESIDDVIMLAIVTALGFSFYENMIYFNQNWEGLQTGTFLLLVISRVTIVTMVHMLCSGILGYYFGLAHFASPVLKLEHAQKKRHPVLSFLKNVLHMKKTHLYRDEMMVIGLILAMFIHAVYDFILSSTVNLSSIFISGTVLLYFFGGYYFLNYLLKKKESRMQLGLLMTKNDDE